MAGEGVPGGTLLPSRNGLLALGADAPSRMIFGLLSFAALA